MSDEKEQIEEKLQEAYAILHQDTPYIPERLYEALEGVCSLLLAWKQRNGKAGWSHDLVDLKEKPLFTKHQSVLIENSFKTLDPELNTLFSEESEESLQKGGGANAFKQGASSDLVKLPATINPKDISIDKLYHTVFDTMDQYDEQWREIANSLGIVKGLEAQDYKGTILIPFSPPIPIPYYVLGKTILPFLNAILDILRLAIGNPMFDIPAARIVLSIVLAFLDLIRGEWKNAVLSLLGVINSSGVVIGFAAKVIHNAWLLISPDLQRELRDTVFRSSKSMVMGFILWSVTTFSPDFVRFAANQFFDKIRMVITEFNEKSAAAEAQAQTAADSMGLKVTFPKIPLGSIPSFDDIQNLQTLAKQPEIFCSPEFQDILAPVLLVPPLRLILELSNIPTMDQDRKKLCVGVDTSALSNAIVNKVTPTIDIIPGGIADLAANPEAALKGALPKIPSPNNLVKDALPKIPSPNNLFKDATKAATKAATKTKKGGSRKKKHRSHRSTRRR